MKKILTLALLWAAISVQAQRRDTVVLSVYNNNQRFMLYPLPFGKDKPDKHFTAEMVMALDTVHKLETSTRRDSSGKYPKRWRTLRECGKLPKNVKGKVVLLRLNPDCDISTQVYNAQKAGASTVIIIHTTNRTDSVIVPKLIGNARYAFENKVKIPCFTIRNVIGEKLMTMLPTLVGIRRPKSIVAVQALAVVLTDSARAALQAQQDALAKAEYDAYMLKHGFTGIGWALAPNPVHEEAELLYNFEKRANFTIEVFTEIGQLVTQYKLPDAQRGKLNIDVSLWQNGVYNVRISSGSFQQNKRLVVAH
ncbi:MAG: T9SS type A sorting domain-containing protein [Saprospiraceae bacterium]|nr:T9SS type A sorting domain-containing protein [Saprospiraceae bacterium]